MIYMNNQYSAEFKLEAVKRYEQSGKPLTVVAQELGVKPTTMQGWVNKYRNSPEAPFPGSGHLKPEDEKLRKMERENRELKEEIEILKKAAAYFARNQK
jgi:transposase